jgi:CheY-like chemotaxis protein
LDAVADRETMESTRILLVDDQTADAEVIISGLRRNGFTNDVDVVYGGEEAFDYVRRRGAHIHRSTPDPALILIDLKLPHAAGRQVLERLKSDPAAKSLPVVVLIPPDQQGEIPLGYDLGANAYVVRPTQSDTLIDVVVEIIRFWLGVNRPPPSA